MKTNTFALPKITLAEAKALIAQGEMKLREADSKVGVAFARYNEVFSGFDDLYGREYNPATGNCDGDFCLLECPIQNGKVLYYVTEYYPCVYKYSKGKYRESKTAYKALAACERAIEKAIDRRGRIDQVLEDCKKLLPKIEAQERAWSGLEALAEKVMQNRRGKTA